MPTLEILSYTLTEGSTADFHHIMEAQSIPLHRAFGIDVVRSEPSGHGSDAYCLMRTFQDFKTMERVLADFYAGPEWHSGPRQDILARIMTSARVVLEVSDDTISAIRGEG
jgi:hypothetical protein